jgi:hypothetical protein
LFGCTNIKNSFFKRKKFKKLSLSHSQTFSNFVAREARFLLQGEKKKIFLLESIFRALSGDPLHFPAQS